MSDAINNYVRPRIRLKTVNSYFVCAENGGGGLVVANRRQADAWETFTLHDLTDTVGSRLQYGRRIALQASGGKFVYPEGGGGGRVVAKGPAVGGWEPFILHSADGNSGDVTPGQRVALQAVGGQFLYPEGGGGAGLVAKGPAIGGWEPLQIAIRPQAIDLQTSNGQFVCAEGGGGGVVVANRSYADEWETFSLYDLKGTMPLQGGDRLQFGTHSGRYFVGLTSSAQLMASVNSLATATTFTVEIIANPMTRVYKVALRAPITGKYVTAVGGGGGALVATGNARGDLETFTLRMPATYIVGPAW